MAKKKFRDKQALAVNKPETKSAPAFDIKTILDIQKPRSVFLVSLLLFAFVAWVFMPSLQCDFQIFDEFAYIFQNPHVNSGMKWENITWAFTSLEYSNWYPLTWLSHMTDVQLYGRYDAWGHHLTSVLLHALNTVLVFLVFRKMTGAAWRSLMVAVLFGLHPLRVESVTWVSERKDVLSTMFWLLAMWAYASFACESKVRGGKTKLFYGLTLLFFVMGLMSKTMLVTLPFVFLLLDYWPLKRWEQKSKWNLVMEKTPFFLLAIIVSIISYVAQQRSGTTQEMINLSLGDRLGNALISYARYLGKFFWPENLCIYYPHPGHWPTEEVGLAGLLVAGISFLTWIKRKQKPYLFVGWFWYLGTLVPVINLVQLCSQSMADRYTYVPLMGIYLVVLWGLWDLTKQRQQTVLLSVIAVAVAILCAALTRYEIGFWKNDITVWSRAIAVTENNYVAHCNLGLVVRQRDTQWGLNEFQQSVNIYPHYAEAQRAMANLLNQGGYYSEAIVHGQAAHEANPRDLRPLFDISEAYRLEGNVGEAISFLQKALSLDPNSVDYQKKLGDLYVQAGRGDEAIPLLKKVVMAETNQPDAFNSLGMALLQNKQYDEAINNFQTALKLAPDFAMASNNLAAAISAKNKPTPNQDLTH